MPCLYELRTFLFYMGKLSPPGFPSDWYICNASGLPTDIYNWWREDYWQTDVESSMPSLLPPDEILSCEATKSTLLAIWRGTRYHLQVAQPTRNKLGSGSYLVMLWCGNIPQTAATHHISDIFLSFGLNPVFLKFESALVHSTTTWIGTMIRFTSPSSSFSASAIWSRS